MDVSHLERLGDLLALPPSARPKHADGVTVIDLTGIAAQDVAVAQCCWVALGDGLAW